MMSKISTAQADGLLFDMDGTLIDSTGGVLATWDVYGQEHGLDLVEVLKTSHGVRTQDNLRKWCNIPEDRIKDEVARFENMILVEGAKLKAEGKNGLVKLPGVDELLKSLPTDSWTIVTSASNTYALPALKLAGVPAPPHMITADDVTKGKPFPEPYLAGASRISKDIERCIVFEDAPSGIKSGVASGAKVLAVCTSHERKEVEGHGAHWIVDDLSKVKVKVVDGILHLEIDESSS